MRSRLLTALLLLCSMPPAFALSEQSLVFDVWLDDRKIGKHEFLITESAEATTVESRVRMELKFLFARLFSYKHDATEVWDGECLAEIRSTTRTNGDDYALDGRRASSGFVCRASKDDESRVEQTRAPCIGSYAYWDVERLTQALLLNSQTGTLSEATIDHLGLAAVPRLNRHAQQYLLTTDEAAILLWYSANGEWLGLETETNGYTLTYLSRGLEDQKSMLVDTSI